MTPLDATGEAQLVASGDASPLELVELAIDRIESLNDSIGAVIITRFDEARAEAARHPAGPFAGVPYLIKDHTLVTRGDLHTQSVEALRAGAHRSDHDSYFVRRMRAAGFVLLGKTNLPELALRATTEPAAWPPTRNPWDLSRSAGGSSGGSAAAVAARMVALAEATDGGGSARMPAGHCGVVGLKPSRGRVSSGPLTVTGDAAHGMGTEALMGRSIRDVGAFLDVVAGHHPGDPSAAPTPGAPFADAARIGGAPAALRVGVLDNDPSGRALVDPEVVSVVREVAVLLVQLGHRVDDAFPPVLREGPSPEEFTACIPVIVARELQRLGQLLGRTLTADDVEASTWRLAASASSVTAMQYSEGVDSLRRYQAALEIWWEDDGWDLLLTPTNAGAPPPLGGGGELGVVEGSASPGAETFTIPYNVSGQPAISLPMGLSPSGLPIGVQLVAAFGREDVLLGVAAQLEQAAPWADRTPFAPTP